MRVLVVDDSALYRKILSEAVSCVSGTQVTAVSSGELALKRLDSETFDLVLLDIFMNEMNGPEVLEKIRQSHPKVSVVMVSGATGRDADITIGCLSNGAMDFIPKPSNSSFEAGLEVLKADIRKAITMARLHGVTAISEASKTPSQAVSSAVPLNQPPMKRLQPPPFLDLLLIGVSTGGPKALADLVPLLSAKLPVPVLLVQHMPPFFTKSLAEQLDKSTGLSVKEAEDGHLPMPGEVLIAPGGFHLEVFRNVSGKLQARLTSAPLVQSCRPSVDVLFQSAAACKLRGAVAVILTGMGCDGADGVANLKNSCPVWCIAQNQATCSVYGMPQAVVLRHLDDEILPLNEIAPRINKIFRV